VTDRKKQSSRKTAPKKDLTLKKQTLRDLVPDAQTTAVKGGASSKVLTRGRSKVVEFSGSFTSGF
jgi:hypothetical protein